jgi:hypothetical protein
MVTVGRSFCAIEGWDLPNSFPQHRHVTRRGRGMPDLNGDAFDIRHNRRSAIFSFTKNH